MTSAPPERGSADERTTSETRRSGGDAHSGAGRSWQVSRKALVSRTGQEGRHRRFRVLVADDDARSLDCLVALLDREGFSIDPANCGFEALARFGLSSVERANVDESSADEPSADEPSADEPSADEPGGEVITPYDFIVLDYNMPDVTGVEVLRRIRVRLGGPLPAIMVSGDYSRELQKSWSAVGGFALLPKPVEPDDFRNQVRQLVQRFFGGGLS